MTLSERAYYYKPSDQSESRTNQRCSMMPYNSLAPSALSVSDCENLIRKMLVVDPVKRISIGQIKQHRWMLADPNAPHQTLSHSLTDYNSNLGDYSEPVLSIMHTLGIDRQRTVEVRDDKSDERRLTLIRIMAHYSVLCKTVSDCFRLSQLWDRGSAVMLNRRLLRDSTCQFCHFDDSGNLVFILAFSQNFKYISQMTQGHQVGN